MIRLIPFYKILHFLIYCITDSPFVPSDEEWRERNERREELLEERKKEGLTIDKETIESLLDEEGRQKRKVNYIIILCDLELCY